MLNKMNLAAQAAFAGFFALLLIGSGALAANAQTAAKPSAKFDRVWVDYDVTEGGVNGMRIHTKFTVYGMKNTASYLAVYFETGDGVRLRDKNKRMANPAGEVTVMKELDIGYDPGVFNDVAVFMPYGEMDLESGEYDLKMDIDLIYKNGTLVQHLAFEDFSFKQPEEVKEATVNKIKIDFDVMRDGKKGMLVHADFNVYGLKGINSYIVVYVQRKNGDALKSDSEDFGDVKGDLAIFRELKPGFEPTLYEDMQLFLPYEEIPLGKGVFDLKLDIDLMYKNGTLFKHLDFYPFVFRNAR